MINIILPGSKSLSQRYLILAHNASSPSTIENLSPSNDTKQLISIIRNLGTKVINRGNTFQIYPGKNLNFNDTVYCGDGATTFRFMAPVSLFTNKTILFKGSNQLSNRSMEHLVHSLKQFGANIIFLGEKNHLPMKISSNDNVFDNISEISLKCKNSSQAVSSLLLWGSNFPNPIKLILNDACISKSYITMTLKTLEQFSIRYKSNEHNIIIYPQNYNGKEIHCELDYSLYPFMILASRISGKEFTTKEKPGFSFQGDRIFINYLKKIETSPNITIDLKSTPDLLPPLAIASVLNGNSCRFTGISHTKHKESDRKAVLGNELRKIGISTTLTNDSLTISGKFQNGATLDAHNDHRLAMSFGLLALAYNSVDITGKESVAKSWPGFWDELEKFK